MAICRYREADGSVQHALYQDGKIAPLTSLGVDLSVEADVTQLGLDWFRLEAMHSDDHQELSFAHRDRDVRLQARQEMREWLLVLEQ